MLFDFSFLFLFSSVMKMNS